MFRRPNRTSLGRFIWLLDMFAITTGDSRLLLNEYPTQTFHACITDPPYGMKMAAWDRTVPPVELWQEVYRTLRPGAFCLAFCSPQLYHRLAVNIEDAGFLVKDQIMWMTTTKMPKYNLLKPAHEPIVVAQKPLDGTIAHNFEIWGCGSINTVSTRIPWDKKPPTGWVANGASRRTFGAAGKTTGTQKEFGTVDANPNGRYPSNIIGEGQTEHQKYFYAPRVTRKARGEYNNHPTPKPISLMAYLVKIYCPPGGKVLDPFCGSGGTGLGCLKEGRGFYGIDLEENYIDITEKRMKNFLDKEE